MVFIAFLGNHLQNGLWRYDRTPTADAMHNKSLNI